MITAVALSPALDVTYLVDRLVGIQRPLGVHRVAGGKALNAARAAVALGGDVTAVAALGGGVGAVVADEARADGVRLVVVDASTLTRTCVSIHSADDHALTEIYEHAAPLSPGVLDRVVEALREQLAQRPGWCVVSGGVPSGGVPSGGVPNAEALSRVLTAAGAARVALDSHGPALAQVLSNGYCPAVLKVNRAEAAEVLGEASSTPARDLVDELHVLTRGVVVVTDGADGAWGRDATGAVRVSLPDVRGEFPVGSGDSFLGGLVVALDRGEPLPDALRLAAAAGTANALVPGAGRFDAEVAAGLARTAVLESVPAVRSVRSGEIGAWWHRSHR